jgi:hypothetical protein
MRSQSGDAVGVEIGTVSFRSLIRALSTLPDAKIRKAKQNPMTDDTSAEFEYKGQRFEVYTPLSDYWIDRPDGCPAAVFEEVVQHLERFPVRWWHRVF